MREFSSLLPSNRLLEDILRHNSKRGSCLDFHTPSSFAPTKPLHFFLSSFVEHALSTQPSTSSDGYKNMSKNPNLQVLKHHGRDSCISVKGDQGPSHYNISSAPNLSAHST
jgi:hypothetical protein